MGYPTKQLGPEPGGSDPNSLPLPLGYAFRQSVRSFSSSRRRCNRSRGGIFIRGDRQGDARANVEATRWHPRGGYGGLGNNDPRAIGGEGDTRRRCRRIH